MSSETDHPRQRTVAELLAEHGNAGATGRRRRRRAADEAGEAAPPAPPPAPGDAEGTGLFLPMGAPSGATAEPSAPRRAEHDRSVLREPVSTTDTARGLPADPRRERSTDVMPRIRPSEVPVAEPAAPTGPLPQQERPGPDADADDAGPSTVIGGAPVEAEQWHRARTRTARRGGTAIDGGPPLPRGPVDADDEPAGLGAPVDLVKHGDDPVAAPEPRGRRLGRAAAAKEATAPAWAAVVMQWVAGALGGAVLWVLFRYLWRGLPVVALAAAVLVTVGLVVGVRALLRADDRRTTVFAVLVGLLLTVSPAILVLMGR